MAVLLLQASLSSCILFLTPWTVNNIGLPMFNFDCYWWNNEKDQGERERTLILFSPITHLLYYWCCRPSRCRGTHSPLELFGPRNGGGRRLAVDVGSCRISRYVRCNLKWPSGLDIGPRSRVEDMDLIRRWYWSTSSKFDQHDVLTRSI